MAGPVWNSASVSHIKPVLQHSQSQQTALSCSASPVSLPCTANPFVVGSSSPPKDPPKIHFAFPCSQPAIFTAGEEAAAEEGGERGQAEPSRRDAPSTCRATCRFDGGWTASGSSRHTAVGRGGNSAPEIMVEKESPHPEAGTIG